MRAEMSAGVLGSAVDWEAGKAELCTLYTAADHCVDRVVLRCRSCLAGVNPDPQWGFNLTRLSAQLEEDGYATTGSEMLP